mmetsp:Transcript_16982/g.41913  ORF Transcript_16982/g.41913 Transcript_16982/m.41913 type:complete len:346 (+) Transcript_16982:1292-2329(+)
MRGVHLAHHIRQLGTNDGVFDERLPEGAAAVRVLERLLIAHARKAIGLNHEAPPLVIEVVHDVLEPAVLLPDEVGHRHLHVVEGDERGARGPHPHAVHPPALHPGHGFLYEHQRDAAHALTPCADCHCEKVRPHPVGDPLLFPGHRVERATRRLGRRAPDVGHVAAGVGLGDAQADSALALEHPQPHALTQVLAAKVEHGGQADVHPLQQPPQHAAAAAPPELVQDDELVEVVEVLGGLHRQLVAHAACPRRAHHPREDPRLVRLFVQLQGQGLGLVPLVRERHNLSLDERADLGAVRDVCVGVVRGVELTVPGGVSERHALAEGFGAWVRHLSNLGWRGCAPRV